MKKVQVGIVGGTGYTGVELLRLLALHPQAEVKIITSRSEKGVKVADMFPNLRGVYDLAFSDMDISKLKECDVVFFATPHGVAMELAADLVSADIKVIDLAADFRLKNLDIWQEWYGMEHSAPGMMSQVAYGLPELNREAIKQAKVIANPGCYPTAIELGFLPLVKEGLIDLTNLVADGKSGVSGAGRGANVATLGAETSESFKAYAVGGHRHLPEISEVLAEVANKDVNLMFVPHLVPMIRGIEATLYAKLTKDVSQEDLQKLFEDFYATESFVDVMPQGSLPDTKMVKGSNMCRLAVYKAQGGVIVTSVIDNLVKGASGQAVQNMNLMFDLPETLGLEQLALMP